MPELLQEVRRYQVELPGGVEEFDTRGVRDLIRTGLITPLTAMAAAGGNEWRAAGDFEELRRYLQLAGAAREKAAAPSRSVSPKRLIVYLALAGLTAGAMMSLLAPICLLIGVFAKFVLSFAAFGSVLALGITTAAREEDHRLINISGGSFAAGGLVAWLLADGAAFTPLHFAVIGLVGTAGLCYGLGFSLKRAAPLVGTAVLLFPLSILLLGSFLPEGPLPLAALPLMIFVPSLPFAMFGGVLGGVMAMTGEKT